MSLLRAVAAAEAIFSGTSLRRSNTPCVECRKALAGATDLARSNHTLRQQPRRNLHISPYRLLAQAPPPPPPDSSGPAPFPPPAPEYVPEADTAVASGTDAQPYDSLYSSSYRGQSSRARGSPGGPERDRQRAPWYKSPTTLVLGFIPVFTFGLGYWQIKRLKWKLSLIEELEDKLQMEPMRLPRKVNLGALDDFAFRLVEVDGQFDYSRPIFVGPRVREGALGYHLVLPLVRPEGHGDALLVNRGFVAETQLEGTGSNRRLKNMPTEKDVQKQTKVLALLPRVYPPNAFTPPNKPEKNEWFHANANEMASFYTGQQQQPEQVVIPVYLEEIFAGNAGEAAARISAGAPVGRAPTIELRNQHAVYAATWFSLSAATSVMFGLLVRRAR